MTKEKIVFDIKVNELKLEEVRLNELREEKIRLEGTVETINESYQESIISMVISVMMSLK